MKYNNPFDITFKDYFEDIKIKLLRNLTDIYFEYCLEEIYEYELDDFLEEYEEFEQGDTMCFIKYPSEMIYLCYGRKAYIAGQDMIRNLKEGIDYELV